VPLAVIGAGYPRTGTSSLKLALEKLGFGPCMHMIELFPRPDIWPFWRRALAGEPVDWEEGFAGFRSTTDVPGCLVYRQLAERYPEAKVILTLREPEAWFASTQATILAPRADETMPPGGMTLPRILGWDPNDPAMHEREPMIARFEAHNAEVLQTIPAERLLVFRAAEGWAPLCAFLGVPIPETPYPRANTSDEWATRAAARRAEAAAALPG
jgi:hypothetical protein